MKTLALIALLVIATSAINSASTIKEQRLKAADSKYSPAESSLTGAVVDVNKHDGMANNPNIKFRSFVCCGLNHKLLAEWMQVPHRHTRLPLLVACSER